LACTLLIIAIDKADASALQPTLFFRVVRNAARTSFAMLSLFCSTLKQMRQDIIFQLELLRPLPVTEEATHFYCFLSLPPVLTHQLDRNVSLVTLLLSRQNHSWTICGPPHPCVPPMRPSPPRPSPPRLIFKVPKICCYFLNIGAVRKPPMRDPIPIICIFASRTRPAFHRPHPLLSPSPAGRARGIVWYQ